jgi:hypothetical protein
VRPAQNPGQFGAMLRLLDSLQPTGSAGLTRLLEMTVRLAHRRSVILFFSDLLEPSAEVELALKQLRFQGHEVLVFQVLDRDEIDFPWNNAQLFEDLETGMRRRISPAAARELYLKRFNAFMEEHRRLFQVLEMSHCVVPTDQSPWRALAMFLAERKRLK